MKAILILRVGPNVVDARLVRRRHVLWTGDARYEGPDDLGQIIAQIAGEAVCRPRGKPRHLCVVLDPPLVQVRHLHGLPPVRRKALRSLVALQAGRFFRRNGKLLAVDAVWIRRPCGQERVALAAAVDEAWLDAAVAGAQAGGLRLDSVRLGQDVSGGPSLEFMSTSEQRRRVRSEWLVVRRLGIAAMLAWIAAAGLTARHIVRESRRIDRELVRLSPAAKALIAARQRIAETARTVEAVAQAERGRAAVMTRIVAVVSTLPDSAYLTSIVIDTAGNGSITGAAKQATRVVAALEHAGAADEPRLMGPAVRAVVSGREWEQFTIGVGHAGAR